ncbi:ammonia monooxygenase [Enterococcus silesiacus]|nr:ammonia monooxygenase [Enterococcus silesiacus]
MSIYINENPSYFKEAINSVFEQTLQPEEVLLVEDGPLTDELNAMISEIKSKVGKQLTIVPLAENVGLGKALAVGVKACRNELIARMDCDDIMIPSRLELQSEEMENDASLAIVGSNITEFHGEIDNVLGYKKMPASNEEIREFSKKRNPFNHMTVMFRKESVMKVGNYQSLNGFEDYYLWVRLLKAGYTAKNIQKDLVYARTGLDMYARRGGFNYLMPGLKARKKIYQEGLGSFKDYLFVSSVHICVSLMPNKMRGWFYEKKLRN